MTFDKLMQQAGNLEHGKGIWLKPFILRERGADSERIKAAWQQAKNRLWQDYPRVNGSDGTRLPDDHTLEYLQDAIEVLRTCGYDNYAQRLLTQAGRLALLPETHLGLADWHGRGKERPFRATLFATGKVRSGDEVAEWGPAAAALSRQIGEQLKRSDEISAPIRDVVWNGKTEDENVANALRSWTENLRFLIQENPTTPELRDLIDTVQAALRFDRTAGERWLRRAVAEGRESNNFYLQTIHSAAQFFVAADSVPGAQLAAALGKQYIEEAGIHLPPQVEHAATTGRVQVNGQRVNLQPSDDGKPTPLDIWMGYPKRAEFRAQLDVVQRALSEDARGEMGREILIAAANLIWEENPQHPAVIASRKNLRELVGRRGNDPEVILDQLDNLGHGIASVWGVLDDQERTVLSEILQQEVQRHPDVLAHHVEGSQHWIFGGNVTIHDDSGNEIRVAFVPPPGPEQDGPRRDGDDGPELGGPGGPSSPPPLNDGPAPRELESAAAPSRESLESSTSSKEDDEGNGLEERTTGARLRPAEASEVSASELAGGVELTSGGLRPVEGEPLESALPDVTQDAAVGLRDADGEESSLASELESAALVEESGPRLDPGELAAARTSTRRVAVGRGL